MGAAKTAQHKDKTQEKLCPKCGFKLERHERRSIKMNGVRYGESGMFWVCTNVKHIKERGQYFEPQCGYERRA
jgi:uncharacterized protein with PIN domain